MEGQVTLFDLMSLPRWLLSRFSLLSLCNDWRTVTRGCMHVLRVTFIVSLTPGVIQCAVMIVISVTMLISGRDISVWCKITEP